MRARSTYQDVMRALFVVLLLLLASCARTKGEIGKVAPGFGAATAWLNVDHPLSLEELRGKVVVVDFWTSCCINCIHTLPVLAAIEHRFEGKPVVVVGVHSAKFDVEGEQERLRSIISEYSIRHPIAVDGSMKIWDSWGARAWPSLYVLDPSGRVVWMGSGEPTAETIGTAVESALAMGPLDPKPLVGLVREKDDSGSLSFPGRAVVLADGTLAIADTGHHRIVLANADGSVIAVAGSGLAGLADGGFSEASFRKPQGIAEKGGIVYVADTENHVLRALDRATRKVTTVAGTGKLGVGPLTASAPATSVALRSPWDVLALGDIVYVALAGSHQIAAFSPSKGTIEPFAGEGEETARRCGAGRELRTTERAGDRRSIPLRRRLGDVERPRDLARDAGRPHPRWARPLRVRRRRRTGAPGASRASARRRLRGGRRVGRRYVQLQAEAHRPRHTRHVYARWRPESRRALRARERVLRR
jgi:thiol-disulfide isomerase/thioredoxin